MSPIDEYLAQVEPAKRAALERIRALALKVVPEATETISYGMPTLKYHGQPFLGFDAHANLIQSSAHERAMERYVSVSALENPDSSRYADRSS